MHHHETVLTILKNRLIMQSHIIMVSDQDHVISIRAELHGHGGTGKGCVFWAS
jgi:hypothetical protein